MKFRLTDIVSRRTMRLTDRTTRPFWRGKAKVVKAAKTKMERELKGKDLNRCVSTAEERDTHLHSARNL